MKIFLMSLTMLLSTQLTLASEEITRVSDLKEGWTLEAKKEMTLLQGIKKIDFTENRECWFQDYQGTEDLTIKPGDQLVLSDYPNELYPGPITVKSNNQIIKIPTTLLEFNVLRGSASLGTVNIRCEGDNSMANKNLLLKLNDGFERCIN